MKNFLKLYKDEIASMGSIFTTLGVIVALGFSVYSLFPKPERQALDLLNTRLTKDSERVVIYNGGKGPAVELKVRYPDKFRRVCQIVNYETSNLSNVEFDRGKLVVNARFKPTVGKCDKGNCLIDIGLLKPNSIFALEFYNKPEMNEDIEIKVICLGEEKHITIFE